MRSPLALSRLHAALVLVFVALLPHPGKAGAQGLPSAPPEAVGIAPEALEALTERLQALADEGRIAGAVGVIARNGAVVYREAVGRFSADAPDPLEPEHLFRIYSMTKPVTAVAVLRLRDRGLLRLEDPVSRFIPEFADVRVYAGGPAAEPELRAPDREPTVADLLLHTAGLTYGIFGNSPVDAMYRGANLLDPGIDLEEFTARISRLPLLASPGDRWVYSLGQDVAGRVVEVASGMSFDAFLRQEILDPLAMHDTSFHVPPGMEGRLVPIHQGGPDGQMRLRGDGVGASYLLEARLLSGGAGLISTVDDFLRGRHVLLVRCGQHLLLERPGQRPHRDALHAAHALRPGRSLPDLPKPGLRGAEALTPR